MYKIPHFTESDRQTIFDFMNAHPFVTLIGNDGKNNVATQIPVLIKQDENKIILRGHIMRKTDHHVVFEKNNKALVLFTGASCYVSASWYSERGHGSTWNYMTVHASGILRFYDDEETIQLLKDLTRHFEDKQTNPELVENMSDEYIRTNVKAIVGFEIEVESLYPVFKLSQNRDDESYKSIVEQLETLDDCGAKEIAEEMRRRKSFSM